MSPPSRYRSRSPPPGTHAPTKNHANALVSVAGSGRLLRKNATRVVLRLAPFRIHADHAPLRRHVGADLAQEILARGGGVGRGLACRLTPGNGRPVGMGCESTTIAPRFRSLLGECRQAPGNGGYNNMDVTQFRAGRAYTDALSVVGKPSAMRGTTWDFVDWCGKKSANGRTFPTGATGQIMRD